MTTLHLISGLPCSGKTTYSTRLADATGAVLFSLDRWLITCFGRYSIAEVGHDQHVRRVRACRELPLAELAARLEARNLSLPTYNFLIREDTLDEFLALYEAPADDEGAELLRAQDRAP